MQKLSGSSPSSVSRSVSGSSTTSASTRSPISGQPGSISSAIPRLSRSESISKDRFGTPYVPSFPTGLSDTLSFIEHRCRLLRDRRAAGSRDRAGPAGRDPGGLCRSRRIPCGLLRAGDGSRQFPGCTGSGRCPAYPGRERSRCPAAARPPGCGDGRCPAHAPPLEAVPACLNATTRSGPVP